MSNKSWIIRTILANSKSEKTSIFYWNNSHDFNYLETELDDIFSIARVYQCTSCGIKSYVYMYGNEIALDIEYCDASAYDMSCDEYLMHQALA